MNDARRLEALKGYAILDTPAEPQFDDIAALAAELCGTPIAAVSFADTYRHWSKATHGPMGKNTSWEDATCSVAIEGHINPLVIEDMTLDPRTREKASVREKPFERFYASILLETPDGTAIGTLCVIDFAPRPGGLTAAQLHGLQALARHTMALLWLRVALADAPSPIRPFPAP